MCFTFFYLEFSKDFESAFQYLKGISQHFASKLLGVWVLFVLFVTCPYNPFLFDVNELENVKAVVKAVYGEEDAVLIALKDMWLDWDVYKEIKKSILKFLGKFDDASLLAKYTCSRLCVI